MFIKSKFFRVIGIVCLVSFLAIAAFADTIRLKNGSIIKGKITSFTGGTFTVVIGDDTRQRSMTFRAEDIASIEFDSGAMPAITTSSRNQDNIRTDGNTKIITVGQTKPSQTNTPPRTTNSDTKSPPKIVNNSPVKPKPITIDVAVLADDTSNGWTNSGWVVSKGQKIRIIGSGRVSLGNGRYATPGGISSLPDTNKLLKNQPTGGLIAVIGDDNNDFIFVGDSIEFVANRDGHLFLGVNEGNLSDNSGKFDAKVEIDPMIGN